MPKKRTRVPDVIWRLFGSRARTLSNTIVSLLPASTPTLSDDMSFLLRPGDSSDYRKLLDRCFVVISENTPKITISRFSPVSHWPQHQIVARTIEMIIFGHSVTSNVICSGYDKYTQSSPLVELLTAPAWCLLLQRVGEEIMVYLLKNASIFLPLVYNRYHQVAGSPISKLFFSMKKHKLESQSGPKKKIKGEDDVIPLSKNQGQFTTSSSDGLLSSYTCVCFYKKRSNDAEKHSQMSSSEAAMEMKLDSMVNGGDNSSQSVQQYSNQSLELLGKRSRPFRWQRSRKRKQFQGTAIVPCTEVMEHKHRLPEKCDSDYIKHSNKKRVPLYCIMFLRIIFLPHIILWQNLWKCCYMVREVPKKTTKETQIDRKLLFYNSETSSSVFPRKHVLNSLKPNTSDSVLLLESIFGLSGIMADSNREPCYQNIGSSPSDAASVCLYHSLMKLLKILIRRAQNCQHLNLLNKHCVDSAYDQNEIESSEVSFKESEYKNKILKKSHDQSKNSLQANDSNAIKSYCLKSQVVSFVWAACRSIIPPELLGTPTNWRILRRNISKFIQLRKFERFSLKQCMHKLKTSAFPYFFSDHSLCLLSNQVLQHEEGQILKTSRSGELNEATYRIRKRLLENWIYWFFSYVVVPLLQANFYVTESECGKHDVFYYKKSVWEKVKKMATNCLKDQSYVGLDNATTREIVKCRRFGFSKLRFLPKENRIRLLANLKAPSRMPLQESYWKNKSSRIGKKQLVQKTISFHNFKSVNSILRDTHSVLKGIQLKEPERLGSSVFDYNDVYRRLCPFLIQLKNGSSNIPGVYIIVSDVAKAFDSVEQKMLLSVIKDVIRDEKYTVKQSCEVRCTKSSLWVQDHYILLDQNIKSSTTSLIPFQATNSVLVNQECSKTVTKNELLFDLNEHIKRNVLQLDKKFYLQRVGISQGSVLSTLLCSLYYGDMDRKVIFPFLERISQTAIQDGSEQYNFSYASGAQIHTSNTSYMLLRFIDDFLFVSTSKQQAEGFFSRLSRGFQDYNCYMNADKFSVNFDVGHISKLPSNRLCIGEDGVSFIRWSGLLINCCTLEVQADYTRHLKNHLSSSLTVSWHDKPGSRLESKLCSYMRPKCHPLFYDSKINSAGVVRLNIFQAFLVCAMKFHCYFCDLSYICRFRTAFYWKIIKKSFRYTSSLIKRRMHSRGGRLGSNLRPVLHLKNCEVEWLGLNAYVQVLKRKKPKQKELLSLLTSKLLMHKLSNNFSPCLSYAVDPSHSSLIWKIKY
ncbi:hypothetical protein CsatB_026866 [Cannabis sativa]